MAKLLVNIDVPDLERAIAFYSAALGLTLAGRLGSGVAELAGAGVPVYLLAKPAGSEPAPFAAPRAYGRHWTPVHLDLVVEDVDLAVARAVAAGARPEGAVEEHAWGRLARLADPFGHGLCVIQLSERGYGVLSGPPGR